MNIRYDDKQHKYYNGETEELISVTQIASEICGINTDYLAENEDVRKAADKGTAIHTELANWYDDQLHLELESDEAKAIAGHLPYQKGFGVEQIVWNGEIGYAGTADLIHITGTTCHLIVDFKTMKKPNKKYCQIQLSLYRLAIEHMGYDVSNTSIMVVCPSGIIELEPLTWDEIQSMRKIELEPTEDDQQQLNAIEKRLEELAYYVEEYKTLEEAYKDTLMNMFEDSNANKYTGSRFKASLVAPSVRVSLDTTKLKAEHPEIYDAYKKESKVQGFIKLTKNGEN